MPMKKLFPKDQTMSKIIMGYQTSFNNEKKTINIWSALKAPHEQSEKAYGLVYTIQLTRNRHEPTTELLVSDWESQKLSLTGLKHHPPEMEN